MYYVRYKLYWLYCIFYRYLTSGENRHALPLFTSLLNTVCAYDPVGLGVPYNHLLFNDTMEPLMEAALQILIVTLDHDVTGGEIEEVIFSYLHTYLHLFYLVYVNNYI